MNLWAWCVFVIAKRTIVYGDFMVWMMDGWLRWLENEARSDRASVPKFNWNSIVWLEFDISAAEHRQTHTHTSTHASAVPERSVLAQCMGPMAWWPGIDINVVGYGVAQKRSVWEHETHGPKELHYDRNRSTIARPWHGNWLQAFWWRAFLHKKFLRNIL